MCSARGFGIGPHSIMCRAPDPPCAYRPGRGAFYLHWTVGDLPAFLGHRQAGVFPALHFGAVIEVVFPPQRQSNLAARTGAVVAAKNAAIRRTRVMTIFAAPLLATAFLPGALPTKIRLVHVRRPTRPNWGGGRFGSPAPALAKPQFHRGYR